MSAQESGRTDEGSEPVMPDILGSGTLRDHVHGQECLDLIYGYVGASGAFVPPSATPENGWAGWAEMHHDPTRCPCEDGMCDLCSPWHTCRPAGPDRRRDCAGCQQERRNALFRNPDRG